MNMILLVNQNGLWKISPMQLKGPPYSNDVINPTLLVISFAYKYTGHRILNVFMADYVPKRGHLFDQRAVDEGAFNCPT